MAASEATYPNYLKLLTCFDAEWDPACNYEELFQQANQKSISHESPLWSAVEDCVNTAGVAYTMALGAACLNAWDVLYRSSAAEGWSKILECILEREKDKLPGELLARGWDAIGRTYYRLGRYFVARDFFAQAYQVAASCFEPFRAETASNRLRAEAELRRLTGNPDPDVTAKYEEELKWAKSFRRSDAREQRLHDRGISNLLHNLALSSSRELARRCHQDAEIINRRLRDLYRLAQTRFNLARRDVEEYKEYKERGEYCPSQFEQACRALEGFLAHPELDRVWPRGRCLALQNLGQLHALNGDKEEAAKYYYKAFCTYKQFIRFGGSRDIAFEEWTVLGHWEVASSDKKPELFRHALSTLGFMRDNLRHIRSRRAYPRRVMKIIEEGIQENVLRSDAKMLEALASWTAQELTDWQSLATTPTKISIDEAAIARLDEAVAQAKRQQVGQPSQSRSMRIWEESWSLIEEQFLERQSEYVRVLEQASLVLGQGESWQLDTLFESLPDDAAALIYFFPLQGPCSVFLVAQRSVKLFALERDAAEKAVKSFSPKAKPTKGVCTCLFDAFIAPVWRHLQQLKSPVRNLFLVPYGQLFALPLHCAFDEKAGAILCQNADIERVLYSPSVRQLAKSLTGEYGRYGETVTIARGCLVIDPACDFMEKEKWTQVANQWACRPDFATTLVGSDASLNRTLEALWGASWWLHAAHGYYPGRLKETEIGAILELADSVLSDLDLLLRLDLSALNFAALTACVTAAMDIDAGNEIAGFVRALKARGVGPIAVSFWQIWESQAASVADLLLQSMQRKMNEEFSVSNALKEAQLQAANLKAGLADSGLLGLYV